MTFHSLSLTGPIWYCYPDRSPDYGSYKVTFIYPCSDNKLSLCELNLIAQQKPGSYMLILYEPGSSRALLLGITHH
jgi:hypothetical protein